MNYQIIDPFKKSFFYSDVIPWTIEKGRTINKRKCFVSIQRLTELGFKCPQTELLRSMGFIANFE